MRWLAFAAMVTLACIRLSNGIIFHPRSVVVDGIPNMFGVCVYSFMCHHSLPSLGNHVLIIICLRLIIKCPEIIMTLLIFKYRMTFLQLLQ